MDLSQNNSTQQTQDKMQVVVEILTGTVFHVQVSDNATVQDLKIAIQNQENLPGDRLILLLDKDGDHLMMNEDLKPLREYGVQHGSRLYAFFTPIDPVDPDKTDSETDEEDNDNDTGNDKLLDPDRTESDSDENRNDNDGNSSSSNPKTPSEEDSVQSPEYKSDSD